MENTMRDTTALNIAGGVAFFALTILLAWLITA